MGNCLVLQAKMVKVTRMDGEILQYPSPLKVQQLLDEFPGHMLSDALPVISYLEREEFMSHEKEYYLLPPKKPVTETGDPPGVVRIKLVLTKQELKQMLRKGGISPDDMLSFVQREQSSRSEKEKSMGWRPTLKSIPEGDDSAVSSTSI